MMSLVREEWLHSLLVRLAGFFRHSSLSSSFLGKRVPNLCLGKVGDAGSQKIRDTCQVAALYQDQSTCGCPHHCPNCFRLFQENGSGGHAFSSSPPLALISSLISESNESSKDLSCLCLFRKKESNQNISFARSSWPEQSYLELISSKDDLKSIHNFTWLICILSTHQKSTTKWKIISIFQVTAKAPKLYDEPLLLPTRRNRIHTIPSELYPGLLGDKAHLVSLLLFIGSIILLHPGGTEVFLSWNHLVPLFLSLLLG